MTSDRSLADILASLKRSAMIDELAANSGGWLRQERAAQIAERANCERLHDATEKNEDYLDGYVDGFERAAALIRAATVADGLILGETPCA